MQVSEPLTPFGVGVSDEPPLLQQVAPDLFRLLAQPDRDGFATAVRSVLRSLAESLGADDACVRCADQGTWAGMNIATSEAAERLTANLAASRWLADQLAGGTSIMWPRGPADVPLEAEHERLILRAADVQAAFAWPVQTDDLTVGVLTVFGRQPVLDVQRLAPDQMTTLATLLGRAALWTGSVKLRREPGAAERHARARTAAPEHAIVGDSAALRYVLYRVDQVAPTNATVLLLGETGTGKELIARAIHDRSTRRHRAFAVIDCGALPATLIESELFGRERGAFTGAHTAQAGRFELANGGTLLLDEIGELPLELQPKLLRVLQEGQVERLGSGKTTNVDVRLIAATNRNLAEEVQKGSFRRDLFYRLNVFPITIPALRERREDLDALVRFLVDRLGRRLGKRIDRISADALRVIENYDWPGNIRELENVLQQAIILSCDGTLEVSAVGGPALNIEPTSEPESRALVDIERQHILRVLAGCGWRIEGPVGAARVLGLRPSTLRSRMRKLGIQRQKGQQIST
ncbi:MAG: sigma-54 interaction domain-containing protein [Vicinamibacterales bacterium]